MLIDEEAVALFKAEREYLDDHTVVILEDWENASDETPELEEEAINAAHALISLKGKYESLLRELNQSIAALPSESEGEEWKSQ